MSEQPPEKPPIVGSDGELLQPDHSIDYSDAPPLSDDEIADEQPLLSFSPAEVLASPESRNWLRSFLWMATGVALLLLLLIVIVRSSNRISEPVLAVTTAAENAPPLRGSPDDDVRTSNISDVAAIRDIEWSPQGTSLAVNSFNGHGSVWDVTAGTETLALDTSASLLAWSPDGARLVGTIGEPATVIWDAQTGERIIALARTEDFNPALLVWSLDGGIVAVNGRGNTLTLYSTQTGWSLDSFLLRPLDNTDGVHSLLWTQGGLFSISRRSIFRWDRTYDEPQIFQQLDGTVMDTGRWSHAARSRDGRYFAVIRIIGQRPAITVQIFFWDTTSASTESAFHYTLFVNEEYSPVNEVFLSTDGSQFATIQNDDIILWDTFTGTQLRTIQLDGNVVDVDWSADGTHLAAATARQVSIYALNVDTAGGD